MIVCEPAARVLVVRVAVPLESVAVPLGDPPSKNVTVPVGVPPFPATVAINVLLCPYTEGLGEVVTVISG